MLSSDFPKFKKMGEIFLVIFPKNIFSHQEGMYFRVFRAEVER